jgi:hypothetical protein
LTRRRASVSALACLIITLSGIDTCWMPQSTQLSCTTIWGYTAWTAGEICIILMIMSGFCLFSYRDFAIHMQWPIGSVYLGEKPLLARIGGILTLYGFYAATAYSPWWFCVAYVALGFFLAYFFTRACRSLTPVAALGIGFPTLILFWWV